MTTHPAKILVPVLASLTGVASLAAQEAAVQSAAPAQVEVRSSRSTPLPDGRNLIIRNVNERAVTAPLPSPTPTVAPSPQPATRTASQETRLLFLNVTRYADNLNYVEWWPGGEGEPLAAWSNADFEALRMVPDVE